MITFACISPHAPILLPSIGSPKDGAQVKNTILVLGKLGEKLKKLNPEKIIISAPHPDWGFGVPLHFLASNFKGEMETILIGLESPQFYFEEGKKFYQEIYRGQTPIKLALIASGDMSHCLRADGPYGFHPDGPKYDRALIEALKKKDLEKILKLDNIYPDAAECGLRSFCFLLGILEASGINYQPEILSYEGPFGVGYLVADFQI
jgi:aromatic ring-opening dioxygenase LigB subunit